jgi:tetratricopeptide (TPR) repeat protein
LVDLLEEARQQRKLLEQAQAKTPNERLAFYLTVLQRNPQDDSLREKIVQLAATLPNPPAIPEEAQQIFIAASSQIKQATTPTALDQPIALLRKVLAVAPWWANAYYNLSRALEMSGQYGDSIQQLKYYLELNPPEADASEARAHLVVLQAKWDTASHKQ